MKKRLIISLIIKRFSIKNTFILRGPKTQNSRRFIIGQCVGRAFIVVKSKKFSVGKTF